MSIQNRIRAFAAQEFGGTTALALSLVMGGFILGGLALDVSYAYKSQNELRIAADAAGHAALYVRQEDTVTQAKSEAVAVASSILPASSFGTVLDAQDIKFGTWDYPAQAFTADPSATDAVMVSTKRFKSNGNAVNTFMLNFLGINTFDVRADSVFVTHFPTCLSQGFAAKDVVDVQSNNTFYSGFCIHSNNLVKMNQNNEFQTGVIISMPDSADVNAGSGNDGVKEALRDMNYRLRILDRMDEIWTSLQTGGSDLPSYIQSATPVFVSTDTITNSNNVALTGVDDNGDGMLESVDLLRGYVYVIDCAGNSTLTIDTDADIQDVVILASCKVRFKAGAAIENALVMTQDTSDDSISTAAAFRMGRDDNCASGGGAQILTYGGVKIPAQLEVFGGQIIAKKDINFAANADAVEGVSFIAGGKIDGTSNANIRFCKTGMEQNFELPFFRLAG